MRTIEQEMLAAFNSNADFHKGNTSVIITDKYVFVKLHGHIICLKDIHTNKIYYSCCGYYTNVTKSRLNALGANIKQVNYQWLQDGKPYHDIDLAKMVKFS